MGVKPLGHKNYGSIPHLPGSRKGPGDHHCHEGQARIATVKVRNKHEQVIVQEKLDGSNVGVALIDRGIWALTRAGYDAWSSPYEQHRCFAIWVQYHNSLFRSLLCEGERLVGEWMMLAHGTRYRLMDWSPFIPFDLMVGHCRSGYDEFVFRVDGRLPIPHVLSRGGACSIEDAMAELGENGYHGAQEPPEGAVWRVEDRGEVNFLVKYVRPDKVDGKYFDGPPVWNVEPKRLWESIHLP